ncbi:MAG: T9SS type A sorting domain-containing protein [Flavobacteriales bacterium]|nr:MAG: T9SS type A sorting domain-containing protein [Flavobacteriales bacterium]
MRHLALAAITILLGLHNPAVTPAQTLTSEFVNAGYAIADLGTITDLPTPYGGLTIRPATPDTLYIGGAANAPTAAVYKVPLIRDAGTQQITGFAGPAILHAPAPNIDGGLSFDPSGTMLYTRYSMNEIGQLLPDNTTLSIPLTPLGVGSSVGSHAFVPNGYPGAGNLILASYNQWALYTLPYTVATGGLYNFLNTVAEVSVSGVASGPEGIAYVPIGSAAFPVPSMVVSAYGLGKIVAFEVDANGLPVPTTARDVVTGLTGAEGAFIDPLTGDFLFSTFGGSNRVVRVSGFELPTALAEVTHTHTPLTASPNPTNGPLRLYRDPSEQIDAVEVLDVNGRVVLRTGRPADDLIDLGSLETGVYVVRAFMEEGLRTARVVRE